MFVFYLTWIALAAGATAAGAALYGRYRVLPAWLTGPAVCRLEDGGCAVLFRSPRARLLGVPNALLGLVLYSIVSLDFSVGIAAQAADPDALYRQRENLASAQQAEAIWAQRLAANAKDFESAWKLARARYWLGTHGPEKARRAALENGIAAGRAAIALEPNKPDGHFWTAANMGALAESFGLRQGLKYRGEIKSELETVLRLDAAFQQGSADRALGRWYYKVPGLFGGSNQKSEEHLRKSLTYNPNSTASLFFLGETLIDVKKKDEARATLQKAIDAPLDPDWAPEDRDFKDKARQRLHDLK
jgi:tetratricopeptide (TPR) repeat protein